MNRGCLVLSILCCAVFPLSVQGQTGQHDSSRTRSTRQQNAWLSGGVGIGTAGIAGPTGTVSGWYSNNSLLVGAHVVDVVGWSGPEVHDTALLVGLCDLRRHTLFLIAAGPAKLGGRGYRYENGVTTTIPASEIGAALHVEANVHIEVIGIGVDFFAARSNNRSLKGATLSLQLGWFGS